MPEEPEATEKFNSSPAKNMQKIVSDVVGSDIGT
jgi:hypothetical protein